MAKIKIRKNLSDEEMLANYKEDTSFETMIHAEEKVKSGRSAAKSPAGNDLYGSMVTPELQEKIGKALLELKLDLYKRGIVDYDIKVVREGNKVILSAVAGRVKHP